MNIYQMMVFFMQMYFTAHKKTVLGESSPMQTEDLS